MKKIVFLLISVLVLGSCTKDFVTKEPLGQGTDITWFKSEENCRLAVNAIYDPLGWQSLYQRGTEVLDMLSDEAEKGGNPGNINQYKADQGEMYKLALYKADATNGIVNGFWRTHYILIARANLMIERTKDSENIQAYKQMRAEARFLRAFAYMDLVKMFGPVPLVTEVGNPFSAKDISNTAYGDADSQIKAIYDFVIKELKEIQGALPKKQSATNFGMVSDAAVRAYLAKAYLYVGDFENSYSVAKSLITDCKADYGLMSQYQKVFDFDKIIDEYTINEIIFSIQYVNGPNDSRENEGNMRVIDTHPRVFMNEKGTATVSDDAVGYGLVIPTQTLVDAFEAEDPRLDMIAKSKITSPNALADSIYWGGVWRKIGKNNFNTGNYSLKNFLNQAVYNGQGSAKDYILMRWAEVLLIGAEAAARTNNTSEAEGWINELRERARNSKCTEKAPTMAEWTFGVSTVPADYSAAEGSLITAVKKERQKELFCENGTRYFDLIRWDKTADDDGIDAQNVLGSLGADIVGETRSWSSNKKYFPIHIEEIRAHLGNITQNPYNK